jgi:hypothetical protein
VDAGSLRRGGKMTNSEILLLLSKANRVCGYTERADKLESVAVVYYAEEVSNEV